MKLVTDFYDGQTPTPLAAAPIALPPPVAQPTPGAPPAPVAIPEAGCATCGHAEPVAVLVPEPGPAAMPVTKAAPSPKGWPWWLLPAAVVVLAL